MSSSWCYSCGKDHAVPRGRNCKEEPTAGHKALPARRSPRLKEDPKTPKEALEEAQEAANQSLAELHSEEKFGSRAEYLEYLEALDADQEEQARIEALEEKIRGRIVGHCSRAWEKTKDKDKDKTPPRSREATPDPRTSTPRLFDVRSEGRDSSADRVTRRKKKFDLKRFTRGKEPRSLSYAQLMYVSLNWACVGIEDHTFTELGEIKKFLRHLGFISFKASSDIYDEQAYAEYDADIREECIWGKDIDEFCFGLDAIEKRYFGTEGLKKTKVKDSHESKQVASRGRGRGAPGGGRGRGAAYTQGSAAPPGRFSQSVRTSDTGDYVPCNRFNGGGCDTKSCNFAHICSKCHDPTHKSADCCNVRMHNT